MIVTVFASSGGRLDTVIARVVFVILAILGAEFIVSFIIEFYRPRTIREMRPIFESKLLSLFTEPGGVMRNIALALDYQFGFKVSGTWIYSFLERSFFPVVLFWALIFLGIYDDPRGRAQPGRDQGAARESRQRRAASAGYLLDAPVSVRRGQAFQLHGDLSGVIGELHADGEEEAEEVADDGHGHSQPQKKSTGGEPTPVVLWTAAHGSDTNNFIVAVEPGLRSAESKKRGCGGKEDRNAASIAFIRMMIPIDYRIRPDGVMDFAYRNADPGCDADPDRAAGCDGISGEHLDYGHHVQRSRVRADGPHGADSETCG